MRRLLGLLLIAATGIAVDVKVVGEGVDATALGAELDRAVGFAVGCAAVRFEGCGEDEACVPAGAELALRVVLDARPPGLLGVQLASRGSDVRRSAVELEGRDPAGAAVEAALSLLEAAGRTIGGRVAVSAFPEDARVTIDGADGIAPLAPGTYRVHASRDGYEPASAEVVVSRAKEARVELHLTKREVASTWVWIAIGAAAAIAGATATAVALSSGSAGICDAHEPGLCR